MAKSVAQVQQRSGAGAFGFIGSDDPRLGLYGTDDGLRADIRVAAKKAVEIIRTKFKKGFVIDEAVLTTSANPAAS